MKLSVTMISFEGYARAGKMSVEEFINVCSDFGADSVDILEYFWKDKDNEIKRIPGLLKEKGLDIGSFCVGNNFIVDGEGMNIQTEYVKRGIDTAVKLGAPRLRIFGGTIINNSISREDAIKKVIEGINRSIAYAKESNILLVLENHKNLPVTSSEMLMILKEINSEYLKVNFDIGNFLSHGNEDPLYAAKELYSYVDYIHAKDLIKVDNTKNEYLHTVTGEGIVPVKECLSFFKQKGYEGYVSLEYEAWKQIDSMIGVKKSLDYLRKVISEI